MKNRYSSKIFSNMHGRARNLLKNTVAMVTSNGHNRKNGVSMWKMFHCLSH